MKILLRYLMLKIYYLAAAYLMNINMHNDFLIIYLMHHYNNYSFENNKIKTS